MRNLKAQNLAQNPAASQLGGKLWTQYVGRDLKGVSGTCRRGQSDAVMVFIIQWSELANWIAGLLGYSYTQLNPRNGSLRRVLPMQHPQLSFLFATQVHFEPLGFGRVSNQTIGTTADSGQSLGPWPNFDFAKLTVTFSTLDYNILPDSKIIVGDPIFGEQTRFVEKRGVGSVEILERQIGSFVFDPNATNAAVKNKPVTFGPGMPIAKKRLTYVWKDVPDVGFYSGSGSDDGGATVNIDACMGCVNSDAIFGKGAGTLLFDGYEEIPTTMPVNSETLGLNGLAGAILYPRSYDIRLNLLELNLPSGYLGATGGPGPFNGHNLKPSPVDGKFYILYQQGTTNTILQSVAFANMFKMS